MFRWGVATVCPQTWGYEVVATTTSRNRATSIAELFNKGPGSCKAPGCNAPTKRTDEYYFPVRLDCTEMNDG